MRKFILFTLVALYISGCSTKIRFVKEVSDNMYKTNCGFFSHDKYLNNNQIYKAKGKWLNIYNKNHWGEYTNVDVFSSYKMEKLAVIPIESCDDIWCKIYYPCSDMKYFVKKDEIIKMR